MCLSFCRCYGMLSICVKGFQKVQFLASSARYLHNELPSSGEMVKESTITRFLYRNEIAYKKGHACLNITCPKFKKGKQLAANLDQIYINSTTGHFVCKSCKHTGEWGKLSSNISTVLATDTKTPGRIKCFAKENDSQIVVPSSLNKLVEECTSSGKHSEQELKDILKLLDFELIEPETLKKCGVLVLPSANGLLFPSFDLDKNVKAGKSVEFIDRKIVTKNYPRIDYQGLFGWHLARNKKSLIITSSERDVLTLYQELPDIAAVCLPKGVSTLPQESLIFLESFDRITIWFDNDVVSFGNAKLFSKKLGQSRTLIVKPEKRNSAPYKAISSNSSLKKILTSASPISNNSIISFSTNRDAVKHELSHAQEVAGIRWKRYPKLNDMLKGHRRGELSIFTGGTGCGKTTFISDYSLDLCLQGVNTLWGSFEINNIRLMKMMLQQFAGRDLSKTLEDFDKVADQFEQLEMFFMNFHGQESIRRVIDTMSHAVYIHDITHVIVDNLQFMMGTMDSTVDRFHKQDMIIGLFRNFATTMNCHVTLVIHPRKEEVEELTTSSIFGGAKASQEADNIMILQRTGVGVHLRKYLQVTKNRFDGQLGSVALQFDKKSLTFKDPKSRGDDSKNNNSLTHLSTTPSAVIDKVLEDNSKDNSQW